MAAGAAARAARSLRTLGRRAAAGAFGVAVAGVAVVAAEIQLARSGDRLPDLKLELDRPGAGGPRIVWLGDSTIAGEGASSPAGTVPIRVLDGLGRPDAALTVLAVSGARAADVLVHQVPRVAAARPDLVLVAVGANDTVHFTGRGDFRRVYEALVRALPAGVPAGRRGRHLDVEVRRVAAATGAAYVDIAGHTGPAFRRDPRRYFSADRFHPSDAGYGLWAEAVLSVLRREGLPRP